MRLKRELGASELRTRLVPLLGNPLVQPLPLLSGAALNDPVGADIEAIPAVLARVREEWQHADSLCRMSGTSFARLLLEKMALNAAHETRDIDLLVVGVETSLWLAEQFVADLTRALPKVSAQAVSANKLTQSACLCLRCAAALRTAARTRLDAAPSSASVRLRHRRRAHGLPDGAQHHRAAQRRRAGHFAERADVPGPARHAADAAHGGRARVCDDGRV
jgi:hypothetical protein